MCLQICLSLLYLDYRSFLIFSLPIRSQLHKTYTCKHKDTVLIVQTVYNQCLTESPNYSLKWIRTANSMIYQLSNLSSYRECRSIRRYTYKSLNKGALQDSCHAAFSIHVVLAFVNVLSLCVSVSRMCVTVGTLLCIVL